MNAGPVDPHFDGIPGLTLGGWLAGRVAALVGAEAEVRLLAPFRSGESLTLERSGDGARALSDGQPIAEGRPWSGAIDPPAPPSLEQARAASETYPGFREHPFPRCFCCGPLREPGQGLRIFPGLAADGVLAAPWIPDPAHCDSAGHATTETLWGASDCPALWALMHAEPPGSGRCVVSGTLRMRQLEPVVSGEPQVVVAWKKGEAGRRLEAGVAFFGPDARLKAVGMQVAVLAPNGVPLRISRGSG
ncbi:MAG TPA: hypothetical protein VFD38_19365 [Myxococcaceae bacterium]|nr:hypothetical protein [Myxococcaceae bacterium]